MARRQSTSRATRKRTGQPSDILGTEHNFRSLSIRDLLQARDQYHWHLMNRANVVGTAIGLYLIRNGDDDPEDKPRRARTFRNSRVRDFSWPCILVMVRDWIREEQFGAGGEYHPEQMVPKTLYMPDGRMVPVCVVAVDPAEPAPGVVPDWHWPEGLYGGGMPIIVNVQGREHRATAGCLVTDGHTTYALTSRHVVGTADEPVYTMANGAPVAIGRASACLTRLPFSKLYPEFVAKRTFVNLDAGLIELDDVDAWTSQIYGLGATGTLANLNELNITLRLIDAPVVASGAASGLLEGRIKALFYRYKSVGGYDYVADFLIAPRQLAADDLKEGEAVTVGQQTQPGDSGAVWHLVTRTDAKRAKSPYEQAVLRPLCVQWGGQVFLEGATENRFAFALATSLTSVCQELDVELVLEHNTGVRPYWGQTGHYSIASFATEALPTGKLKSFLKSNLERISFKLGELDPKTISARIKDAKKKKFVPLADVPDIIWKNHFTKVKGGRDDKWAGQGRATGPEHPTHYADIDVPRKSDHKTLRQLSLANAANLSVGFWKSFYTATGAKQSRDRGLLPFRVWQFFDAMAGAAKNRDPGAFLSAAGLVSHYVGDACQPLHGSQFADGFADQKTTVTVHHRDGTTTEEPSHVGAGVHSTYETAMIDRFSTEIVDGIPKELAKFSALPNITSGKEAATAIVKLMDRSATSIPPKKLTQAYVDAGGKKIVAVQKALWAKFGDETIKTMADGARVLAKIWQGAWNAGSGNAIAPAKLGPVAESELMDHYQDRKFVESLDLDHIGPTLK